MSSPIRGQQPATTQQSSGERNLARRQTLDPMFGFGGDLFRMSPFTLLRMMTEQMDRAFTGTSGTESSEGSRASWMPALEVREKDGNLVICADLPGIDEKDVKIEVVDNMLTIEGERRREHQEGEGKAHRTERSYGRFYRAIELPEGAQAEQAKAEVRNGVLEVKIPVAQPNVNRRQIPIQAGAQKANEPSKSTTATSNKEEPVGARR